MAQTTRGSPVASFEQVLNWETQNRPANMPEDTPPVYTRLPNPPRPKGNDAASITTSHPLPPIVRGNMRLCPHETLSFPRYQHLTHLPNIQQTHHLPLLSKLPTPHHNTLHHAHGRICTITHTLPNHSLHTISLVHLRPDPSSGLFLLHTVHKLDFSSRLKHMNRNLIHQSLSLSTITLCPHKKLPDPWIIGAISRLFHHANNPHGAEKVEGGSHASSCEDCDTRVYVKAWKGNETGCKIEIDRVLGRGEVGWREHCERGEGEGREEMSR